MLPTESIAPVDIAPESQRIPHLGHVVLLLTVLGASLIAALLPLVHTTPTAREAVLAQAASYGLTLLIAWPLFAWLWRRPFLVGLRWNASAVRPWLALFGIGLGFAAQGIETFLPVPPKTPVEEIFRTPHLIWLLLPFAVLAGPLLEEIVFRGFLLPALANAIEWMRLPKGSSPDQAMLNLELWRSSASASPLTLAVASLVTSILFALIHAPQLGLSWPSVSLLAAISLVLCWVRISKHSVAASTLVHACYNLSVFVTLAISTDGFRHMNKL